MKKILPKILIGVIMVSFFLAPVNINIQKTPTNTVAIVLENNKAEAQFLGAYGALYDYWSGNEFGCGASPTTWHKCIVQWIFYLIFMPLAFFARLSAQILDFFIYYSTNSDSYTSDFIEKGWAVVRDVSNLFFIIALLSVAIKTILSMHDAHTKKMVGTIIIVALLINFSLFTTKVVIDASNILAKIFYNNITSVGPDGLPLTSSDAGQKSITLGLVKEFNPHTIFTESHVEGGIGGNIGLFAVLLFLSIGIMVYMIYMFISVTMLFVARVIGLWLSMIFSPLAFASHVLPFDIGGLGYRKWSEDLFKNAFLAPIFIFFLYIIILFGDFLTIVTYGNSQGGIFSVNDFQSYMKIIIPFMIIFGLLMKAKALAVEYSGEMGQNMSKIGAAIGGLALGGAALGTAFIGRQAGGRVMAGLSKRPEAVRYGEERVKFNEKLQAWEKNKMGPKPTWENHKSAAGLADTNVFDRIGGRLNASQIKITKVDHARHEADELKKKAGFEGVSDSNIGGVGMQNMKKIFGKEKKSDFESMIKRGDEQLVDSSGSTLTDSKGAPIKGESGFKALKRKDVSDKIKADPSALSNKDIDPITKELTDQGKKKVEDQLNIEFNAILKTSTEKLTDSKFEHLQKESKEKISVGERVFSKSDTGSYDIRKIGTQSDRREGLGTKAIVGLTAAVALGIRSGMKTAKINPGEGKGDALGDIGDTISEALKGFSINLASGGGGHSKPSGGHGGGGGGGHH